MSNPSGYTIVLTRMTDAPTTAKIEADLESGYLRWASDSTSAALVTNEGRTAVVLYFPGNDGPEDFEVADWYEERVSL